MPQHANMHTECACYRKAGKQTISMKEFTRRKTGQSMLTSHHIIFVLGGVAKYTIAGWPDANIVIRPDEFVFFPASTNMVWEALEDTTVLLVCLSHMVGKLPECHTFRFQRLSDDLELDRDAGVYPLKVNERIRHLIEGIVATQRDGLKCSNYDRHLVAQLLTLIQVYYPKEEYMRFYSTVASSDVVFTDRVYEKWIECRSVGELANVFRMTTQQFTSHFGKVFGQTPGAWLKKRRLEHIYHDICSSHKPLRQIASEHSFSITNLVRYCRMNFGATPGAIRESLSVDRKSVRPGTDARKTGRNGSKRNKTTFSA